MTAPSAHRQAGPYGYAAMGTGLASFGLGLLRLRLQGRLDPVELQALQLIQFGLAAVVGVLAMIAVVRREGLSSPVGGVLLAAASFGISFALRMLVVLMFLGIAAMCMVRDCPQ